MPPVNTQLSPTDLANAKRLGLGNNTISINPKPVANGVKASSPGSLNQGIVNTLPPAYKAPQVAQTTVSNQGIYPTNNNQNAASTPVAPAPPSFGGVIGSLVGASQNGSPTAPGYNQQAAAYGAGSIPIAAQARDIASQFGQHYADVGQKGAAFQAGQLTTGTTPVAEGNAAVTAQTTAAQQQALAQGEQAALQGIGYQLTGQQQAQQGANAAAQNALTGQGQTLTGLTSAAGLAKPELGSPYQIPFSPTDQGQGAPLGSQNPGGLNALAQNYGTFQGIQSGAQALAAAPGTGAAQGIQAVGAAPGQTQASVISTQGQQQAAYQSAHQQAQALQSQLSDLITSFNLNPSDLNAVNAGIQKIAANVSSPQYKILDNYLADVASRYSQILTPAGGSATDTTRSVATGMIDSLASGQSIQDVMSALDNQAQAVIANVPTTGGQGGGGASVGDSWSF